MFLPGSASRLEEGEGSGETLRNSEVERWVIESDSNKSMSVDMRSGVEWAVEGVPRLALGRAVGLLLFGKPIFGWRSRRCF